MHTRKEDGPCAWTLHSSRFAHCTATSGKTRTERTTRTRRTSAPLRFLARSVLIAAGMGGVVAALAGVDNLADHCAGILAPIATLGAVCIIGAVLVAEVSR